MFEEYGHAQTMHPGSYLSALFSEQTIEPIDYGLPAVYIRVHVLHSLYSSFYFCNTPVYISYLVMYESRSV